MAESKFLKACCSKTGRYFGLEVKQYGGEWKVVNMIDLSDEEARLMTSSVKQPSFVTNTNLLPCSSCHGRKVGGCSCAKKKIRCARNMKYEFQCIYCNELKIDYSMPTRADVGSLAGKTIRLSQGQEVKIQFSDDKPLSKIYVGVGWDPARIGAKIDVDSSVVVFGRSGGELVYFGNVAHPSGAVIHHGDNLTGADLANRDDENISVFLDKVPADRDQIYFILNIYDCVARKQKFDIINNLYIRIYDPDSKKALIEYRVTGNFSHDTGLIIGKAFRSQGGWMFRAIGQGSKAVNVNDLARKAIRY